MAQVEKPTAKLYSACAKAVKGDASDEFVAICLDEGDMGAFDEDTNAAATESTVSGLERAAATVTLATVSKADDQVLADYEFTAGAGATITGFLVMSATVAGNALMWCAFAAAQVLESSDKLQTTGKSQFKLGA